MLSNTIYKTVLTGPQNAHLYSTATPTNLFLGYIELLLVSAGWAVTKHGPDGVKKLPAVLLHVIIVTLLLH